MRFKYIGLKTDGERAFMDRTGIEWMPGSEHDVDDKIAAEMAGHPTIWQQVGDEPIALASAALPRARHLPAEDIDDDEANAKEQAAKESAKTPEPEPEVKVEAKTAVKKPAAKTAKTAKK